MTLTTSLNKRSRILDFFGFTLKKQTPITMLVTAFSLLLCPGFVLSEIADYGNAIIDYAEPDIYSSNIFSMKNSFDHYCLWIFVIGMALMVLLTLTNFNFLFSKKAGDMFHSLPLSRKEVLICRTAASFTGSVFTMSLSYFSLAVINYLPMVESVSFDRILVVWCAMVILLLMLSCFTAIFAVCSGSAFDFVIALGSLNVGLPVLYFIFLNFLEDTTYGVVWNASDEKTLAYTSPFIFGFVFIRKLTSQTLSEIGERFFERYEFLNIFAVIFLILFTAATAFILLKIYAKRKSETAGEAFSFKIVPHVISLIISILGGYLIGMIFSGGGFDDFGFWFFFGIGIVLCSIAAGAVFSRGFKTVPKSLIRAGVAFALTVILCVSLLFYGNYSENYLPEDDNIKKITVSYDGTVVLEKDFSIITDIHKIAIKNRPTVDIYHDYKTHNGYDMLDNYRSMSFCYYLKDGRVLERRYNWLYGDEIENAVIRYLKSDEKIAQLTTLIEDCNYYTLEISSYNDIGNYKYSSGSQGYVKRLLRTYAEELKNAERTAFLEDSYILRIDGTKRAQSIYVPLSFVRTRAILAEKEFIDNSENNSDL